MAKFCSILLMVLAFTGGCSAPVLKDRNLDRGLYNRFTEAPTYEEAAAPTALETMLTRLGEPITCNFNLIPVKEALRLIKHSTGVYMGIDPLDPHYDQMANFELTLVARQLPGTRILDWISEQCGAYYYLEPKRNRVTLCRDPKFAQSFKAQLRSYPIAQKLDLISNLPMDHPYFKQGVKFTHNQSFSDKEAKAQLAKADQHIEAHKKRLREIDDQFKPGYARYEPAQLASLKNQIMEDPSFREQTKGLGTSQINAIVDQCLAHPNLAGVLAGEASKRGKNLISLSKDKAKKVEESKQQMIAAHKKDGTQYLDKVSNFDQTMDHRRRAFQKIQKGHIMEVYNLSRQALAFWENHKKFKMDYLPQNGLMLVHAPEQAHDKIDLFFKELLNPILPPPGRAYKDQQTQIQQNQRIPETPVKIVGGAKPFLRWLEDFSEQTKLSIGVAPVPKVLLNKRIVLPQGTHPLPKALFQLVRFCELGLPRQIAPGALWIPAKDTDHNPPSRAWAGVHGLVRAYDISEPLKVMTPQRVLEEIKNVLPRSAWQGGAFAGIDRHGKTLLVLQMEPAQKRIALELGRLTYLSKSYQILKKVNGEQDLP